MLNRLFSFFPRGYEFDNLHNRNIAVIPKSNNVSRLAQNLDVVGFDMTADELKFIAALDKGLRFNDPGHYLPI